MLLDTVVREYDESSSIMNIRRRLKITTVETDLAAALASGVAACGTYLRTIVIDSPQGDQHVWTVERLEGKPTLTKLDAYMGRQVFEAAQSFPVTSLQVPRRLSNEVEGANDSQRSERIQLPRQADIPPSCPSASSSAELQSVKQLYNCTIINPESQASRPYREKRTST
ncbi:hypothetical protein C8Q74DRAFT_1372546 [Fomes fomentarius]|nr:hypothetical protein C8Q74DRAFT_1372546 [Fomes fomentarius]